MKFILYLTNQISALQVYNGSYLPREKIYPNCLRKASTRFRSSHSNIVVGLVAGEPRQDVWRFFARKSMWDSTVSYWSPSVANFVAFMCVCTCGHAASLPFFAKMALGSG